MLTAVEGIYDNHSIILKEDIPLNDGQKVIVTVLDTVDTETNDIEKIYQLNLKREITKKDAWNFFIDGLDEFTDDFMESGREEFVPSRREEL